MYICILYIIVIYNNLCIYIIINIFINIYIYIYIYTSLCVCLFVCTIADKDLFTYLSRSMQFFQFLLIDKENY